MADIASTSRSIQHRARRGHRWTRSPACSPRPRSGRRCTRASSSACFRGSCQRCGHGRDGAPTTAPDRRLLTGDTRGMSTLALPSRIDIREVGMRDGLQLEEPGPARRQDRDAGGARRRPASRRIEVTSFVSPKAVPALADADEVAEAPRPVAGRALLGAGGQHPRRGAGDRRRHREPRVRRVGGRLAQPRQRRAQERRRRRRDRRDRRARARRGRRASRSSSRPRGTARSTAAPIPPAPSRSCGRRCARAPTSSASATPSAR